LATTLAALAANYFWIEPRGGFTIAHTADAGALGLFAITGITISVLNGAWRQSAAAVFRSEARLRTTIASIGDGVITTDARGTVTRMNPVAEELTGWREHDAIGRALNEIFVIVNETTRTTTASPVQEALDRGVVSQLSNHTLLLARDGREVPIDDSAAPIRGRDGAIIGAILVFRDISRRRQTERERAALLASEQAARSQAEATARQLEIALEAGFMGAWQWRVGTNELRWSKGLEAIHGYKPGEFAQTFDAFKQEIHPDDRTRALQSIQDAVKGQHDLHLEYRIVRRDGSERWVEGRGRLEVNAAGEPEFMIGVCLDVTERKRIEEERQLVAEQYELARREADRVSRLKDQFLATLSHELRTPLQSIIAYAHTLTSQSLTPEQTTRALNAIQRNVQAQARLVDGLLELSRIESGKLDLQLAPVDLGTVLLHALDVMRPTAESKGVQLNVSTPNEAIITRGDAARLQQVFWNIISNAIKFTPKGGRIDVSMRRHDSHVELLVTDTGEGIAPEFLPHVFERFSQEHRRGQRYAGLGLGLAIVQELVEAHGGKVVAQSEGLGKGSSFRLTLPLVAATETQTAGTAR
jgi:PAS domain S-box-containing protein